MMSEPRVRYETSAVDHAPKVDQKSVALVLSLDWARAITRLQQIYREGYTRFQLGEDSRGQIRIDPDA